MAAIDSTLITFALELKEKSVFKNKQCNNTFKHLLLMNTIYGSKTKIYLLSLITNDIEDKLGIFKILWKVFSFRYSSLILKDNLKTKIPN